MALRESSINVLPKIYGTVRKTGILKQPWALGVFRSAYFVYKRYVEDPFADLVKRNPAIFEGGHIIDIGANIGYTASIFAAATGDDFKVFAFEPDVSNFAELQKTAERNTKGKIVPLQLAVGSESGSIDLWYNPNHHADHRVVTDQLRKSLDSEQMIYQVNKVSIDDYLKDNSVSGPISFIKMDVQGYELPVCEGLVETLKSNPNAVIAVEYFPSVMKALGFEPTDILDFFLQRGYQLYMFSRGSSLVPFDFDDVDRCLGQKGYFDFLASKKLIEA